MFPKWLKHWAASSSKSKILYPLFLIIGYFNIKPKFLFNNIKIKNKYKKIGKKPPAFIHIPKTGGSSINTLRNQFSFLTPSHVVLRDSKSDNFVPFGLFPIKEYKLKDFFLFTTVRNPLTFFVSYYYHVLGKTSVNKQTIGRHYDYQLASRGFDYLIDNILNRENIWPSRKFLFLQMFNERNKCIVDWVNRQEYLDEDIYELAKYYNFDIKLIPKQRYTGIHDYKKYYSDRLIEIIKKNYFREFMFFGYDGFKTVEPKLNLKPLNKHMLNYDYSNDKLMYNSKII